MNTRRGFLRSGLTAAMICASGGDTLATPQSPAFLVIYRAGSAWTPGKKLSELPLRDHGLYMLDLYRRGNLHMAGGFLDDSGGAAVLKVSDLDQARAIAEADPAVIAGLFSYELKPWRLVDWASFATRPPKQ